MSTSILSTIQSQMTLYAYPICMILGNIGNIVIVILIRRKQENACTIYLISSAITNNVYLIFAGFLQFFPYYYRNETMHAFVFCKMRYYLLNVFGQLSKTMIILACIDRFLITSDRAVVRVRSTSKKAKYLVVFSIGFWLLICSHIPIMTTIINGQCGQFGIYATIYALFTIIFVALIPSTVLGVFGYLTYRNIKRNHVRVQPIVQNRIDRNISIQRRDRDLLIIVISEVFVYVVTTAPFFLIFLEIMISQYILLNKSDQYSQVENFIRSTAAFLLFINCAIPFYIYFISSKAFRQDCERLIVHIYQKLR